MMMTKNLSTLHLIIDGYKRLTFSHIIRIRSEKKWTHILGVIFYIIVLQDPFKFLGSVLVLK